MHHNKVMLTRPPQLENSYNKTILIIESCKTKDQLEGASRMVKNFKGLYRRVGYPKALSYNLDRKLNKQKEWISQFS